MTKHGVPTMSCFLRFDMPRIVVAVILSLSLQLAAQTASTSTAASNPKVRAITGFVRLDGQHPRSRSRRRSLS